jgi:hypothetical protein
MDYERTPPPSVRRLARRLLGARDERLREPADPTAAFERICESLHADLSPLITSTAFHASHWRALHLAAREFRVLGRVTREQVNRGSLEAVRGDLPEGDRAQLPDSVIALLTHLLWILFTLIGPRLTLRGVRHAQPDLPLDDLTILDEGTRDE